MRHESFLAYINNPCGDDEYARWLQELRDLAEDVGVDLELDKYHYYSYFSHDCKPEYVIDDMTNGGA